MNSDLFEDCESPAGAVHRQSFECASDHADHEVAGGYFQQGDQARRDSADSFLRPGGWRASCDTATGPSDTDGFKNREIPDGTVRRQSGGRSRDHDDHAVGAQGDRGARQARRVPDQLDRVLLCTAMEFIDEQIANSLVPMTQARLFEVVESVPELLALRIE